MRCEARPDWPAAIAPTNRNGSFVLESHFSSLKGTWLRGEARVGPAPAYDFFILIVIITKRSFEALDGDTWTKPKMHEKWATI